MTLIESALRKMRENSDAARTPASRRQHSTPAHQPPLEAIGPVEKYLPATVDPVVMEQNCILPQIADDAAMQAYKILRTRLLQRLHANEWQSLVVTGTQAHQGKTLTSVNLAIALAQDVRTLVYLVDLDLRRPSVAASLGMKFEHGISDYLEGKVEADKIIYECPDLPRIAIIPNARPLHNSSELLSSARMAQLMAMLTASTPRRIIIIDMPPLLLADDVLAFVPSVDGVLLVATEGLTSRQSLENAREVLNEMNVVGVILNRSSERIDTYYY